MASCVSRGRLALFSDNKTKVCEKVHTAVQWAHWCRAVDNGEINSVLQRQRGYKSRLDAVVVFFCTKQMCFVFPTCMFCV